MSLCPAFRNRWRSLWHQFFGTIALMEFVLKNLCQQLCSFSIAPCQRSYACPMAQGLETLTSPGRAIFRNNRIDGICPEKPVANSSAFSACRSLPRRSAQAISHGFLFVQAISHSFLSIHGVHASDSLPPNGALPKLFPIIPVRPRCPRFRLAPTELSPTYSAPQLSSPRAISHGFQSIHDIHASNLAPSQQSSPRAISHGFLSVHAACSLPPSEPFPTVSFPSVMWTLPSRSPRGKVSETRTKASEILFGKKVLPAVAFAFCSHDHLKVLWPCCGLCIYFAKSSSCYRLIALPGIFFQK